MGIALKQRILHIIDCLSVGGAEKLLVGTINELPAFEHHIILLRGPETLAGGFTVPVSLINLQSTSIRSVLTKIGTVKKYIREKKIDIVHSHLYESNLVARLATPRSVPLVNSIHAISSLATYKLNKLTLYLEKLTYKKRHVLIAVSKEVLRDFDKWVGVKGPAHVLYNFIDDRFFVPRQKKERDGRELKLVSVGNLRKQKNYPYLLRAFRKMPQNVSLDIYGEGYLRESMQREIDEHKLKVQLPGIRNDLEKILPQYDAFVMSSFYEGQPLSLLEASAARLPAMLSDIPVLREVLEKDALYFDIDEPDNLVGLIKEVQSGKYDLERLGSAAAERVESFARKSIYIKNLTQIYKDILN